ncbi:CAP domain-containing protein [cf. Phormidesmis sp. LEGE 11477]|uniref:CAP domain-containing protein n=1 Tax=cf. Phormidesmis sp. LEGE 11477 TaxID=1828680 RepID=UPI00187E5F15|nr:CAP domain-containing protein [cf. Phormidesmis sp. LEGE 11477]MBE9060652.1 CAP domain-containing protein [cf. Phormidesmis sp. LEGE 11477]
MKWTTLGSLLLVGLVATGCGSEGEGAAQKDSGGSAGSPKSDVSNSCGFLSNSFSRLLKLTNQARAEAGAEPLRFSLQLGQSAQAYAQDLATQNFFSHDGRDGSTFKSRIADTGYDFENAGENLVAGRNYKAQDAFDAWMRSNEGHRENLLSKSFTEVGFGLFDATGSSTYGRYWVKHLGTPESGRSRGGVYIPDECGVTTSGAAAIANAAAVSGASAVAGRSIFGHSAMEIADVEIAEIVPQPSSNTKAIPEPALVTGLALFGIMFRRTKRRS